MLLTQDAKKSIQVRFHQRLKESQMPIHRTIFCTNFSKNHSNGEIEETVILNSLMQ